MESARKFRASPAQLERIRGSIDARNAEGGVYGVWPAHWHAVKVFESLQTQWRTEVVAKRVLVLGLDPGALPFALAERRNQPHRQPLERLMPQLRTLELGAMEHLNRS